MCLNATEQAYRIRRTVLAVNAKCGLSVPFGRFMLDAYLGGGLRYVGTSPIRKPQGPYADEQGFLMHEQDIFLLPAFHLKNKFIALNPVLGVKLGFFFGKNTPCHTPLDCK
jgi:hypothetical protein